PTTKPCARICSSGQGWSHVHYPALRSDLLIWTRLEPCPTIQPCSSDLLIWTRLEPCLTLRFLSDKAGAMSHYQGWSHVLPWNQHATFGRGTLALHRVGARKMGAMILRKR